MKNLRISELLLLSELESRAKRIVFHPDMTLVLGKNDTGKSSILKSIYRTFGAEPAKMHPDWKQAEVSSLVKFSLDDIRYSILKKGDVFAIFDAELRMIGRFTKVTSELGPFLADMVSFKLKLAGRESEIATPPPAYFFLPYYIDQDVGWTDNWASFAKLGQFTDWRRSVVEYHTGIRPNEYYAAKAALQVAEDALHAENQQNAILSSVRLHMQNQTRVAQFDVSLDDFKSQLVELLERCRALLAIEEQLKETLRELNTAKILAEARRGIVSAALREVGRDYAYATTHLVHDTVDCPTCGATYDNSFAERFEIAKDEDRLAEMLFGLDQELREIQAQIDSEQRDVDDNRSEARAVSELLESRKSEISLGMVLQSEGRKEVDAAFLAKLAESRERQEQLQADADRQKAELEKWDDKDHRREIVDFYRDGMRAYLHELNVTRLPETSFRRIDSKIVESGSDQPRALLAYFVSILRVMRQYSTTTFCPVVIDSPNQQAQDAKNLAQMLAFIRDRTPAGAQVILALEDLYGLTFPGDIIELNDKNRLLQEEEYAPVREEMAPLFAKVLTAS